MLIHNCYQRFLFQSYNSESWRLRNASFGISSRWNILWRQSGEYKILNWYIIRKTVMQSLIVTYFIKGLESVWRPKNSFFTIFSKISLFIFWLMTFQSNNTCFKKLLKLFIISIAKFNLYPSNTQFSQEPKKGVVQLPLLIKTGSYLIRNTNGIH